MDWPKFNTSDFLPKTVKNRDGKDVRLLGIVVNEAAMEEYLQGDHRKGLPCKKPFIVMFTEDVSPPAVSAVVREGETS